MEFNDFIPPLSDFGFKNLFGKGEKSKENLRYLLNEVLKDYPGMSPIIEIHYQNVEHQGDSPERKSTRFDVFCKTENGETFVVEMQNEKDRHLKQRMIFYLCQTVTEQDYRHDRLKAWDYNFPRVIVIMFCNFIDNEIDPEEVNHFGILNLKTHREFGNHIGLTILQLPLFPDNVEGCHTEIEKIVYTLTHMENIIETSVNPFSRQEGDFYDRIKNMSTTAALNPRELHDYHQWLKVTNDDRLRLEKAEEKGQLKEKWETARILFDKKMTLEFISEVTGLPIQELKSNLC